MKKLLAFAVVISFIWTSAAFGQGLSALTLPGLGSLLEDVKVNPSVQVGFSRVGSNMNLPVGVEGPIAGLLQIGTIDLSLQDANFWTGTAGISVKSGELLSLLVAGGGILGRQFGAPAEVPVSLGPLSTTANIDFTASKVESWYIQTAVGVGPILGGLYWDHFTVDVGDPRRDSVPLANQTLRGYVVSKTFAPFVGFALPASNALLIVMYSPLAASNTTLALRTSNIDVAQAQYKWNKPGNLVSCTLQYNLVPINSVSFGFWGNYSWMNVRGNAELDFQDSTLGVSRQKDVTATMTRYVLQGGVTLGVIF